MNSLDFGRMYSAEELRQLAENISKTVVIRTYEDGCSKDTRRKTTKKERDILFGLAYGAMVAYGRPNRDIDSILDMAEFSLQKLIPGANTYDSIYIPLRKITETGVWSY